jgi:pimeloyl-ACP methyl ester carboxylesterase
MRSIRRAFKIVSAFGLAVVVAVAVSLGILWIDHTRSTTLPVPSGPFAVGRTTLVWKDPVHVDPLAPQPGTKRELFVWVWYPAAIPQPPQAYDSYLPISWREAIERNAGPFLRLFATRDLSRVRSHNYRDAGVSTVQTSYPVVFMRGGAAAQVTQYTSLAEDLASHGYVVVGFDAPYRSTVTVFPDGRVIARAPQNDVELVAGKQQVALGAALAKAWSADISYALDQLGELNTSDPSGRFTGKLDLNKVGAFGHSLGGATVLKFCHDDPRCKAGIDIDGLPLGDEEGQGLKVPFMFLLSDHSMESSAETAPVMAHIRSIYDKSPPDRRVWVSIRGAGHFRFSDGAMLQFQPILFVLRSLGIMHLEGRRQVEITERIISTFFDNGLKGTAPVSALRVEIQYPEVQFMD